MTIESLVKNTNTESNNVCILHEVIILHKLVSKLSLDISALQEENEKYKNDIKTLQKVVIHFDESQATILTIVKNHQQKIEERSKLINEESCITNEKTKKQKNNRKKHLRRKEKDKQEKQDQDQEKQDQDQEKQDQDQEQSN